jgi:hypothetical protein
VEQLSFLGLTLLLALALLASGKQFPGTIQQLPLPLADLDGINGVISGDLLGRLATTDRLQGDCGFEFGSVGAALNHQ